MTDEQASAGSDVRTEQIADLAATTAELRVAVGALTETVQALPPAIERVGRHSDHNRIGLWLVSAGFALDIALTITMAFVVVGLVRTNDAVRESLAQDYVTAQQQAQTRVQVLCPLYEVLLAAVANPSPEAQATPAAKAQFDLAVKTIRDGYGTLGCVPPLPPATPSGTSTR